ncbi:hypothetical protein ABEB36_005338 [Hypothenemus hampei]|uniref:Uncharacterized protein n=1 Tax=Hypothenemus hampei TaxID=57062 RepID=A0ABD1EXW7_HYPHA
MQRSNTTLQSMLHQSNEDIRIIIYEGRACFGLNFSIHGIDCSLLMNSKIRRAMHHYPEEKKPKKTLNNSNNNNHENERYDYYLDIDPGAVKYVSACFRNSAGDKTSTVLKSATFKQILC